MMQRVVNAQTYWDYIQTWQQQTLGAMLPKTYGKLGVQLGGSSHSYLQDAHLAQVLILMQSMPVFSSSPNPLGTVTSTEFLNRITYCVSDFDALPLLSDSVYLLVVPDFTLNFGNNWGIIKDIYPLLEVGGHIVLSGVNPFSLYGLWMSKLNNSMQNSIDDQAHRQHEIAHRLNARSVGQLSRYLESNGLKVVKGRFGCYRLPWRGHRKGQQSLKSGWIELMGDRWWPTFGSTFALHAVKQAYPMNFLQKKQQRFIQIPAHIVKAKHIQSTTFEC